MNRNIICIVIALAVLSSCAYLIGELPWQEIAVFQSTFNKVPINVTLDRKGHELPFEAMDIQELFKYSDIYEGQFVRFTGTVNFDFTDSRNKQLQRIELADKTATGYPDVHVYLLELLNPLETYERGQKYEFTGFLVRYEEHRENRPEGQPTFRLYAFDIRHVDEKEEKK